MESKIIIKDKLVEEALARDGFTVVPMIGKDEIKELSELYYSCFSNSQKIDKYNLDSNADCQPEQKIKISNEIQKILRYRMNLIFDNYEFLPSIFFTKKSSEDPRSKVGMHQDPTLLIDESENCHIKIWCPLMDVDETNGALQMIKGSHQFVPPVAAVTIPPYFSSIEDLLYETKECVCMKAGEALLFDNRIIHCSMPNLSGQTRVSVILSVVAANRQFISLYRDPKIENAPIEVYFQEHDWYAHPLWHNNQERPKIGKREGILDYELFYMRADEFSDLVKNPRPYKLYNYKIISERQRSVFYKFQNIFKS